MVTGLAGAGSFLRPAQTYPSKTTWTPMDASPAPAAGTDASPPNATREIPVSSLNIIDISKLKVISIKDYPELRDRMATNWLNMQAAQSALATEVPDNAPQNVYATVKANGTVVATLYNGGTSQMTNAAAAEVGDLQDPPGLTGGPDLAQWRAEAIAQATGGTIEKAPTAIAQAQWTPRQEVSRNYTRTQLDAAFEAMTAENQKAAAQRSAGYSIPPDSSGTYADFNA